jgi:O-antigen/teichoic acid export membrane protein
VTSGAEGIAIPRSLSRRLLGQGALLTAGFGIAQVLSFCRNALFGYMLSKGDFGIAATITIALQMLETLSDLGADRLIVQRDDESGNLLASAHSMLVLRGLITGALLLAVAWPVTQFLEIPQAAGAFALAALVPMVKGLLHLEPRRRQRQLDNTGFLLIEVVPQLIAVLAAWPVLRAVGTYWAVVWLALLQAVVTLIASHIIARVPYRLGRDRAALGQLLTFGWPIWLSAFPLVAVYQGDRMIVAKAFGMEALAGYTAAFMITMVPGLLAAKIANALVLPVLAGAEREPAEFARRYRQTCEIAIAFAAIYFVAFALAGGKVLPWTFGANYYGLGAIVGWLALMFALRMVQAVPGMALLATGQSRPLLVAGCIRASALALSLLVVMTDGTLAELAAAGAAGELASMLYVAVRAGRNRAGLARAFLLRTLFLVPAGAFGLAVGWAMPFGNGALGACSAAAIAATAIASLALLVLPELRHLIGRGTDARGLTRDLRSLMLGTRTAAVSGLPEQPPAR